MFGLCMPTGEVYLILKSGEKDSIEISDLVHPRKEIMEDKWLLQYIKKIGYEDVKQIVYKRHNHKTVVEMAEYYSENAKELDN